MRNKKGSSKTRGDVDFWVLFLIHQLTMPVSTSSVPASKLDMEEESVSRSGGIYSLKEEKERERTKSEKKTKEEASKSPKVDMVYESPVKRESAIVCSCLFTSEVASTQNSLPHEKNTLEGRPGCWILSFLPLPV